MSSYGGRIYNFLDMKLFWDFLLLQCYFIQSLYRYLFDLFCCAKTFLCSVKSLHVYLLIAQINFLAKVKVSV